MISRSLGFILVFSFFATGLAGCSANKNGRSGSILEGKPAPDFELSALDGGKVRLSDLRGKPVLLAFFGHGCPPCRAEAPHLSELARKYKDDGLVVLAVNPWDEDKSTLEGFAKEGRLSQKILLEGSSVGSRYGITGVPSSFWIDRNGIVVDSHTDFEGPEVLDRKTRKLLAKQ